MLVGPHPHSLSLGGPASPGFPPAGHPTAAAGLGTPAGHPHAAAALGTPAPRSGRRRYIFLCSWGPTPTRSHSAARLRRASLRRLARAAGATFFYARGAPPPLALTRRPGFAGLPSGASLGPQALHYFLLCRAPEHQRESRKQQPTREGPRRALVDERHQALDGAVRLLNDIAAEEHRIEDSGERSARNQPRA